MPVKEASSEVTPYCRYVTSEGWFVHNLADALAVRNEEKGAMYPLEPREAPFADFGVNVRVVWPGDPSALYHAEGVQGFLVLSGESHDRCTAGGGDDPLRGERRGGEVRRVRRKGDRRPGGGLCRLAGRVPADARGLAARLRREAVTRLGSARECHPTRARRDALTGATVVRITQFFFPLARS
jgi:hypothetical protein